MLLIMFSLLLSFQSTPGVCVHMQDLGLSLISAPEDSHMCGICKCDVSSQGIIGQLSPRQPCPTSPCSCIRGPTKQCLACWSHDPRGNNSLTHDLDFPALSVIMELRVLQIWVLYYWCLYFTYFNITMHVKLYIFTLLCYRTVICEM